MFKQTIEFTTHPIEIITIRELTNDVLTEIYDFIQFVKYDFNQDIHNSSAYLFNASDIGTPTLSNENFTYYLKKNIECVTKSKHAFNPFYSKSFKQDTDHPDRIIDINGYAFAKERPILFNTKLLMEAFVVDTVYEMLKLAEVHTFSISSRHVRRVDERQAWNISYPIEEKQTYKSKIQNGTVFFYYPKMVNKKRVEIYNIDKNKYLIPRVIVIESIDAITCRIYASMTKPLTTKREFEDFAFKHRIQVIVYDDEGQSHRYSF